MAVSCHITSRAASSPRLSGNCPSARQLPRQLEPTKGYPKQHGGARNLESPLLGELAEFQQQND